MNLLDRMASGDAEGENRAAVSKMPKWKQVGPAKDELRVDYLESSISFTVLQSIWHGVVDTSCHLATVGQSHVRIFAYQDSIHGGQ